MGNNKYKILIVEDEANIRSFIKANLETSDYQVLCAETCELGMMMYASHHPDLILLDLGLPDRDGMSLIQEVRETDTVPIIVLSARSNERDKVEALDLGANDYITKPFGTEELLARIRAVLRSHRHSEEKESSHGGKFRLQDLLIDYDTRQVFVGKEEIDLTQTEYNIMAFLSVHAGKVLTYAAIIRDMMPDVQIFARACPMFVPLVENGYFNDGNPVTKLIIAEYLQELKDAGVDTLILGCTHYPLLKKMIGDFMGDEVHLVDSGKVTAQAAAAALDDLGLLNGKKTGGTARYFVSDTPDNFDELAHTFLGEYAGGTVERIAIETY